MNTSDWIQFALLFVTALALLWQIYRSNQLAHLENFRSYTERYQDIFLKLPVGIEDDDFQLALLRDDEKENLLRWIRAYFDLCSEEYYLQRRGYLCRDVWKLWNGGMKDSFKKPAFKQAWSMLQKDGYYASEFAKHVSSLIG